MISLSQLSIRGKFAIPLVIITLMVIIISVLSISSSQRLSDEASQLSEIFVSGIDLSLNADRDLYQALTASQSFVIASEMNSSTSCVILVTVKVTLRAV
ncbi:hypothetical protein DRW07_10105 [Alteromonas sediminis]|uniref:Chemotaxis methyl-accepting receptor HlyB-like 4HB MCP domain-containing protein n=1 Tax=Alteromonas sediminis TaxID=2259342 RepID=A0A3N5Y723_9ALTE|nr:hypothetical protein [Alteromonas sediminis]RPJ66439.1 hypothetical protein DRW07_10105 [Alteromonas sediminis]